VEEEWNPKIWVDLRMGTPKKETMIRCNVHTPQEGIEAVATEEWEMDVKTQQPLPEKLARQAMIWFKKFVTPPTEEEREAEAIMDVQFSDDEADVKEMEPRKAKQIRNPMLGPVIRRVNSLDDLRKEDEPIIKDPDMLTTWEVHFDELSTWFTAPQGLSIQEAIDLAMANADIPWQEWKVSSLVHRSFEITVYCTTRAQEERRASIHFGNQTRQVRVNARLLSQEMLGEAQTQRGILGQWRMRSSAVINKELHVEAEEIEDDAEYPALAEVAEARIYFQGSILTTSMKRGDY
jgi:hypothetical protein